MPPEETPAPEVSQPAPESPSPAVESPALATEPVMPTQEATPATTALEASPAPPEAVSVTETVQSPTQTGQQGPLPFSTTDDRQENQVAQIPPNEPIEAEPEPIETPEPPSTAASAPAPVIVQTGILHTAREFLGKARVAIQDRKRKKRDKIMQALGTKNKITNDGVEKLLHVSDATATRYLSALEKEGKIIQVGKTGHGVVYSKI